MQGRPKLPVEIKGLAETLSAMRKFEPDLAKNLNKEVRAALTPIQKTARGYVPSKLPGLSGWTIKTASKTINKETSSFAQRKFPSFNAALVRRGIKIYIGKTKPNNRGFVTFYSIRNTTAAGAIMETAGRKNPSGQTWDPKNTSHDVSHSRNPEAGLHFINSMGGRLYGTGKTRGRLIYRAVDEDHGRVTAQLVKAVEKTVVQFKRRADAQVLRNAA
jgi:hypothetical protein